MMDPQRTLPLVIRARVYIAVKFDHILKILTSLITEISYETGGTNAVSLHWMQMILSAIYIVSPIDIIPEGDSSFESLKSYVCLTVFSHILSLTIFF